ncbi:ABC transporter permease [Cellulomonas sp. URHD0024]|uniref:ABC transporter permease n=1 Tax=Cellulomonas sp. URHD0024 TaxID=1302620 RepID=UPI0003F51B43|nr:ABC transporter permease [Cellulomonas sp. URHD0024]
MTSTVPRPTVTRRIDERINPSTKERFGSALSDNRVGLVVLIALLVVAIGSARPTFWNPQFVMGPMLTNIAIYSVVGLSQMAVLSIGQMNLAVGGMAATGGLGAAIALDHGAPLVVGMVVGVIAGAACGAVCGLLVTRADVNSFVVTLAMSFALLGLVPAVYGWVSTGAAITVDTPGLAELGRWTTANLCLGNTCGPAGVPLLLFLSIATMVVVAFGYARTRVGRETLLTGSSAQAALLSAIPVGRRVTSVHALSGALAGLAGVMLGASTGSFTPSIGQEFLIPSFLGPILGGTLLVGGYVSVLGTSLGIALTVLIRQGLLLFGVGIEGLNILLGSVLLLALCTDRIRDVMSQRSRLRASLQGVPASEPSSEGKVAA